MFDPSGENPPVFWPSTSATALAIPVEERHQHEEFTWELNIVPYGKLAPANTFPSPNLAVCQTLRTALIRWLAYLHCPIR